MLTAVLVSLALYAVPVMPLPPAAPLMQASSDSIQKDAPFHVEANHDGIDTDSYSLLLNTAVSSTVPVTILTNGVVAFPRFTAGLPKGTYQIVVRATGPGGSTDSGILTLTVTAGNPSAPGQVRIIKGGQ